MSTKEFLGWLLPGIAVGAAFWLFSDEGVDYIETKVEKREDCSDLAEIIDRAPEGKKDHLIALYRAYDC